MAWMFGRKTVSPTTATPRALPAVSGTVVEFAIGVRAGLRLAWEYEFKGPDSAKDGNGQ
jgi:hypothetical protein